MTLPELLKIMFPNKSQKELSEIWKVVFSSELSTIMARPTFDIIALDILLQKEYGEYKGSMKYFIKAKFGDNFLKEFNETISI